MSYNLFQYVDSDDADCAGIVIDDRHYPLLGKSMADVLADWPSSRSWLRDLSAQLKTGSTTLRELEATTLRFAPPVPRTATVYGAGANYRDHAEAMARAIGIPQPADPKRLGIPPWHFMKPGRATLAAHGQPIPFPANTHKLDWEAELAVVIGKTAYKVDVDKALEYVAGYSCANDLSARDKLARPQIDGSSPFHFDWLGHKCFLGSCPMGPTFTPAEFVGSPEQLSIRLWVNGTIRQDSSTANHIYSVAEQIAFLSSRFALFPGDVILTGTPAGVGMESGTFLSAGDVMRVEIEGLGILENVIS